jgi:hypothetical protein
MPVVEASAAEAAVDAIIEFKNERRVTGVADAVSHSS